MQFVRATASYRRYTSAVLGFLSPQPFDEEDIMSIFKNGKEAVEFGNYKNFLRVINDLIKEGIFELGIHKDSWVLKRVN